MDSASLFALHPWLPLAAAALLGLVAGSFLNVVIVRLPVMMELEWAAQCAGAAAQQRGEPEPAPGPVFNLALPASHCPACEQPLRWYDNVPVLGWLVLRGRCRDCGAAIAWRYPAVELATALLFAGCLLRFGPSGQALAAMVFCAFCLTLAVIDARTLLLPDALTLALLWLGLGANLWGLFVPLHDAVIGAMAGYGCLWLLYWAFRLATGREGMGHGDFKLLAALGAWLGWQALPALALAAALAGVAMGGGLLLWQGRAVRSQPIPFGPYLAASGVLVLFAGHAWSQGW